MKKAVFVLLLLLMVQWNSSQLYAQEPEKKSSKNNITFNLTRLFLMEARFGYERQLTDRHLIRTTVGIQFPSLRNPSKQLIRQSQSHFIIRFQMVFTLPWATITLSSPVPIYMFRLKFIIIIATMMKNTIKYVVE